MTDNFTNRGKFLMANGGLAALDLRMLVFTGTQTGTSDPDLNFVADLDAVSGVAIHSERIALTGETITEDDTNDRVNIDAGNVVFAAAVGVTAQGVAIFDETVSSPTDANRQLIAVFRTNFPAVMDGGLTVAIADWARVS